MFLYWIDSENRYTHTKTGLKEGTYERREIPTDTHGLMGFLNDMVAAHQKELDEQIPEDKTGMIAYGTVPLNGQVMAMETTPPPSVPMDASAVLSRVDNPGVNVEKIIETIMTSRGHALKRYAGAVALAFEGLRG